MSDKFWMELAFEQASLAGIEGEVPVGAVLVSRGKELLGVGRNSLQNSHDPSGHAEVNAIRQASQVVQSSRLVDSTLF